MSTKNSKKKSAKALQKVKDFLKICPSFSQQDMKDGQCAACSKKAERKALFATCSAETKNKAVSAKTATKAKAVTSLDSFGFRYSSEQHAFIMHLYNVKNATMKEIKSAAFNKRPNTFYCAFNKLSKAGFAVSDKNTKKMSLTKEAIELIEKEVELKKAA